MKPKPTLKADLEGLFKGFRWTIKGFIDEEGKVFDLPDIPQVITGIFQEVAKQRLKPFLQERYKCGIVQGGAREYPEITAFSGRLGQQKIAIDIKTTRRISENRVSGFSIGSYAGYFLYPELKRPGCKFPYGEFKEHWVVGFVYSWNPKAHSLHKVGNIEVVVSEKWRIASKSTATGTTFAISSIRDLKRLREGKGDFTSPSTNLKPSGEQKDQGVKKAGAKSEHQLSLVEEWVSEPIPSTRYQGSKAKLVNWIWELTRRLDFDSVLDLFGGTGVVGYMFKRKGKAVCYNDYLKSNYLIGLSLIENNKIRLTNGDIKRIMEPDPSRNHKHFISETFPDIYYTSEENEWLDTVVQNIAGLQGGDYKKALAYNALFQACLVKRPFNLFHRRNLYLRFATVYRSFGNKTTWDRPFAEHFLNFLYEVNGLVFDNDRENKAFNLDALQIKGDFDMVYIDPPYTSVTGVTVDYLQFYHFLEGLSQYDEWSKYIDLHTKHRSFRKRENPWNDPKLIRIALRELLEHFRKSILVVSYREDGIPAIVEIVQYLEDLGKRATVHSLSYKYVLSNNHSAEVLIIAQ